MSTDQSANNIYRFNFSDSFTQRLFNFSKVHEQEERKEYKENWKLWLEANKEMVERETKTLKEAGFYGDTIEKMYKSARYYFRKKKNKIGERIKENKIRKTYIMLDLDLLKAMDEYMVRIGGLEVKPSTSFDMFCAAFMFLVERERERMKLDYKLTDKEFDDKIKKTYKNRYFNNLNKKT